MPSPLESATPVFGKQSRQWEEGRAKTVTLVVTEACQLRCRYCYLHGKNDTSQMSFDIAKRTVDHILDNRELFPEQSVIWEFIGGEPFLAIDLIDEISDYIKRRSFELDHPWFNSYRFNFSTNGILYSDARVQRYIAKNRRHVSVGITIDGTREKHDLQRVYADGRGSYDDVVRNIPLWLEQFPDSSTKVTVAHDDLPFVYESVLHLWGLGIKTVNINVVFENTWKDGADRILEEQLVKLADYVIRNRLHEGLQCSFFSDFVGKPLDPVLFNDNYCGAGRMLAVDSKGNFYPCIRLMPFAMEKRKARVIGNCFDGIDTNRLRPFLALDRLSQSTKECVECDVAGGCAWCTGLNYDDADTETIYQRATFLCRMHKARARANRYYSDRLARLQRLAAGPTSSREREM